MRRAGPCRRSLSRAADQGRPPRRHRRADRKPGRGAQGARLEGAGRPRDRPAGDGRHADRGDAARIARRPTGWPRSAAAGDDWAIAAADISTGRFELVELRRRASSPPSWRGWRRPRRSPTASVPGHRAPTAGKGGFDSLAGERALKSRFGVATLDGFGAPSRAELAAAGGLLAYLDATQKGAGILLDAPRRIARGAAIWRSTRRRRESLELTRSASRQRAGSLLGAIDRCQTGAGARLLAADIAAPLTDQRAIEARLALVALAARGCDPPRARARRRCKAMPDIGRALGRLVGGPGQPARPRASCATGSTRRAALKRELEARARPPATARRAAAAARRPRRAGRPAVARAGRLAADSTRPRAATSPKAMTPRSTSCAMPASNGRRAIAALEARYRDATGISSLKIRHNGVLGYHVEVPAQARRPADGARQRLHPPPDAGRRGPLQLARAARGGEPGGRGRRPRARRRGRACRGADRRSRVAAAPRSPPPPTRSPGIDVAAGHAERAAEGGWCRPQLIDAAVPRDRRRPPSGGRGGAARQRRALRRQRSARSARTTGCGWSPAPTWAASRPSCARTR